MAQSSGYIKWTITLCLLDICMLANIPGEGDVGGSLTGFQELLKEGVLEVGEGYLSPFLFPFLPLPHSPLDEDLLIWLARYSNINQALLTTNGHDHYIFRCQTAVFSTFISVSCRCFDVTSLSRAKIPLFLTFFCLSFCMLSEMFSSKLWSPGSSSPTRRW